MEEFVLEEINKRIGRNNAITMEIILYLLFGHRIINAKGTNENRRVRRIIEKYPKIHSCEDGYYVARKTEPEGEEDVKYAVQYLHNKAMPILKKARDKKRAFPQYYGNEDQGELPYDKDNNKPV